MTAARQKPPWANEGDSKRWLWLFPALAVVAGGAVISPAPGIAETEQWQEGSRPADKVELVVLNTTVAPSIDCTPTSEDVQPCGPSNECDGGLCGLAESRKCSNLMSAPDDACIIARVHIINHNEFTDYRVQQHLFLIFHEQGTFRSTYAGPVGDLLLGPAEAGDFEVTFVVHPAIIGTATAIGITGLQGDVAPVPLPA